MYRGKHEITLKINSFGIMSLRCIGNTALCINTPVPTVYDTLADKCFRYMNSKFMTINTNYSIKDKRVKYNCSRTYMHRGISVPEYIVTIEIIICINNQPAGKLLTDGIIAKLIKNNKNSYEFDL